MKVVVIYSIQLLIPAVQVVHGGNVIHIVLHRIRVQRCFVSKARLLMHGLELVIQNPIG